MLINWFVSSFGDDHYLRHDIAPQDLKLIAVQFCTHLLAAGIVRQIEDANVSIELIFKVRILGSCYLGVSLYFYGHL